MMNFKFRPAIFLLLQYFFCLSAIHRSGVSELDLQVYILLSLWGISIIIFQSFLIYFVKKIKVKILFLTLFSAINFLLFYQAYDNSFVNMSLLLQVSSFVFNIVIFAILFYFIWKSLIFTYSVGTIYIITIGYLLMYSVTSEETFTKWEKTNYFDQPISDLSFEKKPDVHIVIYDSMVSKRPSLHAFGEVPKYYKTFIEQEMLIYENSFVERITTRPSLKKFFALGDGAYPYGIIVGYVDSPLAKIFRQNGYYIQVGTRQGYSLATNYMKKNKNNTKLGSYFDEYFYDDSAIFSASPLCVSEISSGIFHYFKQHYWFCDLTINFLQKTRELHGWPQKVLKKMRSLSTQYPVLTLSYMYYPVGHTKADYNYTNKSNRDKYFNYFTKASKYLSQHFSKLKEIFVGRNKPYVLLIFGDHGTLAKQGGNKNKKERVIDRYNVFTGVEFNDVECESFNSERASLAKITSPSRLMVKIINCISGNNEQNLVYPIENHELEIYKRYGLKIKDVIK